MTDDTTNPYDIGAVHRVCSDKLAIADEFMAAYFLGVEHARDDERKKTCQTCRHLREYHPACRKHPSIIPVKGLRCGEWEGK